MPKVPLVVLDSSGNRNVVGTATVDEVAGELVVTGNITNPHAVCLDRDRNLEEGAAWDYSVGFIQDQLIEAVQYPIPAMPAEPLYKNPHFKE